MTEERIVEMMIEAYIKVYGAEKWNSMTKNQKDEVLHIILNDMAMAMGIN